MVSRVVAPDQLINEAKSVASRIASLSAPMVQMIKAAVMQGLDGSLSSGLALERRMFHLTFALNDRAEGMAAFIEKWPPSFQDR